MNTIAIMRNTMDILKIHPQVDILKVLSIHMFCAHKHICIIYINKVEERTAYLEAFMAFDSSNNGNISNKNLIHALRRVGHNPTDVS